MARYFFNLRNGQDVVVDTTGTELATRKDIRIHMMCRVAEFIEEVGYAEGVWQIVVVDEAGDVAMAMEFGMDPIGISTF